MWWPIILTEFSQQAAAIGARTPRDKEIEIEYIKSATKCGHLTWIVQTYEMLVFRTVTERVNGARNPFCLPDCCVSKRKDCLEFNLLAGIQNICGSIGHKHCRNVSTILAHLQRSWLFPLFTGLLIIEPSSRLKLQFNLILFGESYSCQNFIANWLGH